MDHANLIMKSSSKLLVTRLILTSEPQPMTNPLQRGDETTSWQWSIRSKRRWSYIRAAPREDLKIWRTCWKVMPKSTRLQRRSQSQGTSGQFCITHHIMVTTIYWYISLNTYKTILTSTKYSTCKLQKERLLSSAPCYQETLNTFRTRWGSSSYGLIPTVSIYHWESQVEKTCFNSPRKTNCTNSLWSIVWERTDYKQSSCNEQLI